MRHDDIVNKAAAAGHKGVGKPGRIFVCTLFDHVCIITVCPENNLHGSLGPHHRNLCGGPGKVDIPAQMFGAHHVVGTAIGLAGDERHLGDSGLGIGVEQFGAVFDNAAIFLRGAGQKAGHIDKGDNRDVEGITEPDKPGRLA